MPVTTKAARKSTRHARTGTPLERKPIVPHEPIVTYDAASGHERRITFFPGGNGIHPDLATVEARDRITIPPHGILVIKAIHRWDNPRFRGTLQPRPGLVTVDSVKIGDSPKGFTLISRAWNNKAAASNCRLCSVCVLTLSSNWITGIMTCDQTVERLLSEDEAPLWSHRDNGPTQDPIGSAD